MSGFPSRGDTKISLDNSVHLGQAVNFIGNPSNGLWLPANSRIKRTEYPELSARYATNDRIQVYGYQLPDSKTYNSIGVVKNTVVTTWDFAGEGYISTDAGATWNLFTFPSAGLWELGSGGGKFIALKAYSTEGLISTDGVTWTPVTIPNPGNAWKRIIYATGKGFLASSDSTDKVLFSPDGINWSQHTLPASDNWYCSMYGNGLFVIAAYNSTNVAVSTDGQNWTAKTRPSLQQVATGYFGAGKFVCVGTGTNTGLSSEDGENWSTFTLPSSQQWILFAGYEGGFLYSVQGSTLGLFSKNGTTDFKAVTLKYNSTRYARKGNDEGVFVSIGYSSQNFDRIYVDTIESNHMFLYAPDGTYVKVR